MGVITCKYEYLTDKARAILDNRCGYRDNTLFPKIAELSTSSTNPLDVVSTEILYCGKYEICDFLINHYSEVLSRSDYRLLLNLVRQIKTTGFPIIDIDKKEQISRITNKLVGSLDHCVWLCALPEDIYDFYIKDYIPRADKIQPGYAEKCPDFFTKAELSLDDYTEKYIEKISIPENAVILCDLGISGSLIAFDN